MCYESYKYLDDLEFWTWLYKVTCGLDGGIFYQLLPEMISFPCAGFDEGYSVPTSLPLA